MAIICLKAICDLNEIIGFHQLLGLNFEYFLNKVIICLILILNSWCLQRLSRLSTHKWWRVFFYLINSALEWRRSCISVLIRSVTIYIKLWRAVEWSQWLLRGVVWLDSPIPNRINCIKNYPRVSSSSKYSWDVLIRYWLNKSKLCFSLLIS